MNIDIISFGPEDRRLCKRFVDIHWRLYKGEDRYIPLLDYEYLGFKLIGMTGYIDTASPFFKHGRMRLFIAHAGGKDIARICAFVNDDHNAHTGDKTGFFAFFDAPDDAKVTGLLLDAAGKWLKEQGMEAIRGPQNLPVNESTPGVLVEGYDAEPVIYYHYNHPYYASLLEQNNMSVVKRITSMDVPIYSEVNPRLVKIAEYRKKKHDIRIIDFTEGNFKELRKAMLDIYNDAWGNNWGFVPFREEDFYSNLEDMRLVWDPKMFWFLFIGDEPAAFFGVVPNILDRMKPLNLPFRHELLRAAKMILTKNKCRGIRLGYFGIKHAHRGHGLDALIYVHSKLYMQKIARYKYCHVGWVLEDNEKMKAGVESMSGVVNRVYASYERPL